MLLTPGEESDDLPFKCGEELTIIEPCSVKYWYIAENSAGRRGTIPITFVKVTIYMRSPLSKLIAAVVGKKISVMIGVPIGVGTILHWGVACILAHDILLV